MANRYYSPQVDLDVGLIKPTTTSSLKTATTPSKYASSASSSFKPSAVSSSEPTSYYSDTGNYDGLDHLPKSKASAPPPPRAPLQREIDVDDDLAMVEEASSSNMLKGVIAVLVVCALMSIASLVLSSIALHDAENTSSGTVVIIGNTGATGPQGPPGDPGYNGTTGPQGPAGTAGGAGPAGPAGTIGGTGPQGPAGTVGGTGPQGPAGTIGGTGPQGPAGTVGATGPAGPAGTVGGTGPQGVQGTTGNTGAQGNTGATGPAFATSIKQLCATTTQSTPNNDLGPLTVYSTSTISVGSDISSPSGGILKALAAGTYLATATVQFASNNNGERQAFFLVNNDFNNKYGPYGSPPVIGDITTFGLFTVLNLAVNDQVQVNTYQTSGGALNSGQLFSNLKVCFTLERIY